MKKQAKGPLKHILRARTHSREIRTANEHLRRRLFPTAGQAMAKGICRLNCTGARGAGRRRWRTSTESSGHDKSKHVTSDSDRPRNVSGARYLDLQKQIQERREGAEKRGAQRQRWNCPIRHLLTLQRADTDVLF